MVKKLLLILVIILALGGTVFAGEDGEDDDNEKVKFPRHTITIDFLPTVTTLFVTLFMNDSLKMKNVIIFTGLQYEFQITQRMSVAGRAGLKYISLLDVKISSWAFDANFRLYPTARFFFLNWGVGYTYFTMSEMPDLNLLTIGMKIGWRIDFGGKSKPGGFIMEPSFGYTWAGGAGNSFNDISPAYRIPVQWFLAGGFSINLGMGARF